MTRESELYKMYLDQLEEPRNVATSINYCDECDTDMVLVEFFHACPVCGQVGDTSVHAYHLEHATDYITKRQLYKRRAYIEEKLRLLSCIKRPRSAKYLDTLNKIKVDKFISIDELYNILKKKNMSTMYKHIYNLWFDVKKTKLVTLTSIQIGNLCDDFVKVDCLFKNNPGDRKNMYNYNTMIYFLMKKNKIQGCNHILLPYNHNFIYKHVNAIWLTRDK